MAKKVLIVDDSLIVRQQVGWALMQSGYEILEAADGEEGLQHVATAEISLVICDVNMPRMDGLAMLERMRERGATCPVVMLTSEGQPDLIARAKALGAKGWMVKPVSSENLVAVAKKLAVE